MVICLPTATLLLLLPALWGGHASEQHAAICLGQFWQPRCACGKRATVNKINVDVGLLFDVPSFFMLLQAHAAPPMPRDDRLDLGSSGKSRSDPARTRSLRTGGARGRGRHSIDLGHDLKRAMAAQTIHEDVRTTIYLSLAWSPLYASHLCTPSFLALHLEESWRWTCAEGVESESYTETKASLILLWSCVRPVPARSARKLLKLVVTEWMLGELCTDNDRHFYHLRIKGVKESVLNACRHLCPR
jgi:hypothetical protein